MTKFLDLYNYIYQKRRTFAAVKQKRYLKNFSNVCYTLSLSSLRQ